MTEAPFIIWSYRGTCHSASIIIFTFICTRVITVILSIIKGHEVGQEKKPSLPHCQPCMLHCPWPCMHGPCEMIASHWQTWSKHSLGWYFTWVKRTVNCWIGLLMIGRSSDFSDLLTLHNQKHGQNCQCHHRKGKRSFKLVHSLGKGMGCSSHWKQFHPVSVKSFWSADLGLISSFGYM